MLYYILAYVVGVGAALAAYGEDCFEQEEVEEEVEPDWLDYLAMAVILAYGPIMLFLWVINL